MSHATYTRGNRGDSQLLVVGSQIANLTPDLSFGHNLCFRCPNGSCKPILEIYVPRSFQWYKELFNPLSFDPYNCSMKIQEFTGTPTPKVETPLEVHSLTLSYTLGSMRCDSWASLLAHNLVSLCFGLEPKAKVVTEMVYHLAYFHVMFSMCGDSDSCRRRHKSTWQASQLKGCISNVVAIYLKPWSLIL